MTKQTALAAIVVMTHRAGCNWRNGTDLGASAASSDGRTVRSSLARPKARLGPLHSSDAATFQPPVATVPRIASVMDQSPTFAGLSKVERWLFSGTISLVVEQASSPETDASKAAAKSGLSSTVSNVIGREVFLVGFVLAWGGLVAEAAFQRGWGTSIAVAAMGVMFPLAIAASLWGCVRITAASRSARRFRDRAGVILTPGERVPMPPLPRGVEGFLVGAFGIEVGCIGASLVSTQYAAPRIAGGFFIAMGLPFLAAAAAMLLRRRRSREQTLSGRR